MATKKQKTELVEAIKAEPTTYEIVISGYGGEIVIGSITKEQYEHWVDRDDLDEHANDWDNDMGIDEELAICKFGSWHDCDDLAHESGCEYSDYSWITVYDDKNNEVWSCQLEDQQLESHGVDPSNFSSSDFNIRYDTSADYVFIGQSFEKGTFWTGNVEVLGKFKPEKLGLVLTDVDGWLLVSGVTYNDIGVEDTDGYSTNGKGEEYRVIKIDR